MEQENMVRRRSRHDVPNMGCLMVSFWKQELDSLCQESSMHGTALQRQRAHGWGCSTASPWPAQRGAPAHRKQTVSFHMSQLPA